MNAASVMSAETAVLLEGYSVGPPSLRNASYAMTMTSPQGTLYERTCRQCHLKHTVKKKEIENGHVCQINGKYLFSPTPQSNIKKHL